MHEMGLVFSFGIPSIPARYLSRVFLGGEERGSRQPGS